MDPVFSVGENLLEFTAPYRLASANSCTRIYRMRFNELVRLLEQNGFRLIKEKGSIRYYGKPGVDRLIRVEIPTALVMPF